MKRILGTIPVLPVLSGLFGLFGLLMTVPGCTDHAHDPDTETPVKTLVQSPEKPPETAPTTVPHVHPNPKYNEVLVEFPGHKYAMEIIEDKETTGLVTAFVTTAHFEPTPVDAKTVRVNFLIGDSPKIFTLTRIPQEAGQPATFTLKDMELATLVREGWHGGLATAFIEIGGVPYNSRLIKLGGHVHNH